MADTHYPTLEEIEPDPAPSQPATGKAAPAGAVGGGASSRAEAADDPSAGTNAGVTIVPLPKTWWVQPGKLLAGCFPGDNDSSVMDQRLTALLDAGIRCVLCLQEEEELSHGGRPFMPYRRRLLQLAAQRGIEVAALRFPVKDMDVPSRAMMDIILDTIDSAQAHKLPTYVHCWAGHGRTGTVVGCWLVRHGLGGDEALAQIARLREFDPFLRVRTAPQTDAQRAMIRSWLGRPVVRTDAQSQAAASSGNAEMTGTHEAINYILRKGYTPAVRSESADFRFELGQKRYRRVGLTAPKNADLRLIVGYAFDKLGVARYVVKINENSLSDKEAHHANTQYGPVVEVDESVVRTLSLMLGASNRSAGLNDTR